MGLSRKEKIMSDSKPQKSEFIFYTSPNGDIKIEVFLADETIWLTINKVAELFDSTKQNVSYHLQNIYKERELNKKSTVKEILTVQSEGGRKINRKLEYYNLDAIIAVGYRVNSKRATQFRIWATRVLKNYKTSQQNRKLMICEGYRFFHLLFNYIRTSLKK